MLPCYRVTVLPCYRVLSFVTAVQHKAGLVMSGEIRHLFVTLKRGFAGTRDTHIKIIKSLGLTRRQQTVQKANVASVRGAIDKVLQNKECQVCNTVGLGSQLYVIPCQVKHLVTVETEHTRAQRLAVHAAKVALREPVTVQHQQ